jgi:hypothetical protein
MLTTSTGPAMLRTDTPLVGVHGGAGTSTLCRWLGSTAQDHGLCTPEWDGRPVVLVTAGTAPALARTTSLVSSLVSRPLAVRLVLAVVADSAAPEPGAVRSRVRALSPSLSAVVRFPYVEVWRYVDDPLERPAPARYLRALRQLVRAVHAA